MKTTFAHFKRVGEFWDLILLASSGMLGDTQARTLDRAERVEKVIRFNFIIAVSSTSIIFCSIFFLL